MHPQDSLTYRPCGTEYQEVVGDGGSDIPRCGCGLFAIGACAKCGQYACGTHGSSLDAVRGRLRTVSVSHRRLEDFYACEVAAD